MTVDLRTLPRAKVTIALPVDCFEARGGRPVRQNFNLDFSIPVDRHGEMAKVAEFVRQTFPVRLERLEYLGGDGRTYLPYRTVHCSILGDGPPAFAGLDKETRILGSMLGSRSVWYSNIEKKIRPEGHWNAPHRSTGSPVEYSREALQPRTFDPSKWRLDEQGEVFVRTFEELVFQGAVVGASGLLVQRLFPVWKVDPRNEGVEIRLALDNDDAMSDAPWIFSASRLQDAQRFRDHLVGVTGRGALPQVDAVLQLDAGWDRRNDLVQTALALTRREVPKLSGSIATMPSEATRLWHGLINAPSEIAEEGVPAARRHLEAFVAMREQLMISGGSEFQSWCQDTTRQTARLVEIEGIGASLMPAPGIRP